MISDNEVVKLKPISNADIEIFRTISFISRIRERYQEVKQKLSYACDKNPFDTSALLAYGIFNLSCLEADGVLMEKNNIENALIAFEQILFQEPGYWIVQIYKYSLLLKVPNSFRDDDEIAGDLESLIELQKHSEFQPYFIMPYILLAELFHTRGDKEKGIEYIRQAEELPKVEVRFLPDFLAVPLFEFENRLKKSGEIELAKKVNDIGRSYFPAKYRMRA
jgi:tetratricopeptide (TPR) repeat protein